MKENKSRKNNNRGRDDTRRYNPHTNSKRSKRGDKSDRSDCDGNVRNAAVTNDPAWYTRFPQLTRDAASLWFSQPLGVKVPRITNDNVTIDGAMGAIPGIGIIHTILGPGTSADANSPLNATSRDIYSFIRHANSGHANYNAPDLTMYLLALDSYYTVWAKMVRAYGTASLVTKTSRYTAIRLLQALGFDPTNILSNLAQFRYLINNFAVKLASYATPGSMDIYKRHTEIYANIYMDSTSNKAQAYMLDPSAYYVYGEESAEGGKLTYTEYPDHLMTIDDVIRIFDTFNSVIQSEDMNIISGDILKAYGINNIFNVPAIPEEYTTPVVVDMAMLSQIENATILGTMVADSLNISQNPETNQVIYMPSIKGDVYKYPKLVLNYHGGVPDINAIMEATRLMVTFGEYNAEEDRTPIIACGADMAVGFQMYYFDKNDQFVHKSVGTVVAANEESIYTVASSFLPVLLNRSFAYAPRVVVYVGGILVGDTMNYDEYMVMSDQNLWNIHNAALLSLFDVPRIAMKR